MWPVKIVDMRCTPVAIPTHEASRFSWGAQSSTVRIVVELTTDDGRVGLGECAGGLEHQGTLRAISPSVLGQDPFHIERLRWLIMSPANVTYWGNSYTHAFAAIEMACFDLMGKATGKRVVDLLGGPLYDAVPCAAYAFFQHPSAACPEGVATPAQMVRYCAGLIDRYGFRTVKVKGGVFPPREEFEVLAALHDTFPDVPLRWDPNGVWSIGTALRIVELCHDRRVRLEYLEDPVFGLTAMATVRRKAGSLPLATNTSVFALGDLPRAVAERPVDIILGDLHWYGGMTGLRALAQICQVFDFDLGLHSGREFGISMAAHVHAVAALPNISGARAIDSHYHMLVDDVLAAPLRYVDGAMRIPDGPGLGVELDTEKVARYHEEYLRGHGQRYNEDPVHPGQVTVLPKW